MKRIFLSCLVIGWCIFFAANHVRSDSISAINNEIIINGCQSGVLNRDYHGSLISTWIDECSLTGKNHGDFVSCVAKLTGKLKRSGLIDRKEKRALQECASKKSSIVLYNASIYTMENEPFIVEAVLIKGKK